MKKTLLLSFSVFSCLLHAAEVQDHTAMQQKAAVGQHAGHDVPVMIHAGTEDLVASAGFNRLEWQKQPDGEAMLAWDFTAYVGNDDSRWWLKSEGAADDENTEEGYVQLVYSQPVSPFWDVQLGVHGQIESVQENYLLVGLYGLAPWYVDINSYLLFGEGDEVIWRFEADYDFRLAQHWVLLADLELTVNAQNNAEAMAGSGLAESVFGVRFACDRLRKLVPYAGIEWQRSFGNSRDYHELAGEEASAWLGVVGVNIWY